MGLYNRFCKHFFAAVIIRLTAQSDSRAPNNERIHMNLLSIHPKIGCKNNKSKSSWYFTVGIESLLLRA